MKIEQVSIPAEIMAIQTACHELGHSLVMVAIEDQLVGAIELQPTIRPEAAQVIAALHERNLTTAIISGDQEAPTRTLARELGIERYFANVLPEEKAAFVSQLQAEGTPVQRSRKTVCFVGDGINDAIALTAPRVPLGEKSRGFHLLAWCHHHRHRHRPNRLDGPNACELADPV